MSPCLQRGCLVSLGKGYPVSWEKIATKTISSCWSIRFTGYAVSLCFFLFFASGCDTNQESHLSPANRTTYLEQSGSCSRI
jgi:hypothetical protein